MCLLFDDKAVKMKMKKPLVKRLLCELFEKLFELVQTYNSVGAFGAGTIFSTGLIVFK